MNSQSVLPGRGSGLKRCGVCKEEKSLDNFHKSNSKGGLYSWCKVCTQAVNKKYREENPAALANLTDIFRQRTYGLAPGQYDDMVFNQGGKCAICSREARLGVDHDHETGKVRALLCHNCNVGIGHLKDSYDLVTKAAEYLKKHKTP